MEYDIYGYNPYWITDEAWYTTSIFTKLHGTVFLKYIINARTDRYNIIFSIDAHKKRQPWYVDNGSSVGGNAIKSNLTTYAIALLGATVYFIDCWIKGFDPNYQDW